MPNGGGRRSVHAVVGSTCVRRQATWPDIFGLLQLPPCGPEGGAQRPMLDMANSRVLHVISLHFVCVPSPPQLLSLALSVDVSVQTAHAIEVSFSMGQMPIYRSRLSQYLHANLQPTSSTVIDGPVSHNSAVHVHVRLDMQLASARHVKVLLAPAR